MTDEVEIHIPLSAETEPQPPDYHPFWMTEWRVHSTFDPEAIFFYCEEKNILGKRKSIWGNLAL